MLRVCQSVNQRQCKNCVDRGIQLTFKGEGYEIFKKIFQPSKISLPLHRFIKKFLKNIPAPYRFHSPQESTGESVNSFG